MREDLKRRLERSVGGLTAALRDIRDIQESDTDELGLTYEELDALVDMDILAIELRIRLGHLEHGREASYDA